MSGWGWIRKLSLDTKAQAIEVHGSEISWNGNKITLSGSIKSIIFAPGKNIEYTFDIIGDRAVLDEASEYLPAPDEIQFGERQKIDLVITGGSDKFKIKVNGK